MRVSPDGLLHTARESGSLHTITRLIIRIISTSRSARTLASRPPLRLGLYQTSRPLGPRPPTGRPDDQTRLVWKPGQLGVGQGGLARPDRGV